MFFSNFLAALSLFTIAIFIFIFAVILRWHNLRGYWQRRSIPGPPPKLFSGNLDPLFFGHQSGVLTLHEWTRQFGPVYGIRWGQTNVLVISEPAMVHQLFVTKFDHFHGRLIAPIAGNIDRLKWVHLFNARGARWKRLRAIATPAFSVANLKKMMPTIAGSIKHGIGHLEKVARGGQSVNIHDHFVEMAFDIIARVAMGQPESRQFCNSNAQLAVQAIHRINNNLFDYYAWIFPWFGRNVLHPMSTWMGRYRGNDPIGKLLAKIADEVEERKKQQGKGERGAGPKDFIDFFLDAESEDMVEEELGQDDGNGHIFAGRRMEIRRKNCLEEVVMQCFLFLLAGFDTIASSLSQICYQLVWHPDVQAKMQEEIDRVLFDGEGGDEEEDGPSYEELAKLKYMEAVIREALRLSPRVTTRICTQTTLLGNILVDEGTAVQVDILSLHRDKRIWGENAAEFVPERWESTALPANYYYAFGAGPRMCIGWRMALAENKMALVHLLRKFNLRRCEQTEREIEFVGQVVLAPKSVTVRLEPR